MTEVRGGCDFNIISIEGETFPCHKGIVDKYVHFPSNEKDHEMIFTSEAIRAFLNLIYQKSIIANDTNVLFELNNLLKFYTIRR